MTGNTTVSGYGRHIYILKRIRNIGIVIFVISVVVVAIFFIIRIRSGISTEKRELLRVWSEGDFERSYEISKIFLVEKPVDYFLLTVHGFSSYQLGISQINNQNTLAYIDECIFSLRKAILQNAKDGRVCYVLGKAYYYKGGEYSDLAVKYLEMADELSYEAADIPEYLGLSYAAYGDYRSSVEAFSRAFTPGQTASDNLLLPIARSYMAMEDYSMAVTYLQRCIDHSTDSKSVIIARFMLAEIFMNTAENEKAENQYLSIINETNENAQAYYQLGELYNRQGDTTRARSAWRDAYRQDPTHAQARARLSR